ncbi:DUF7548 family protein [Haloprofundus salinisoli]|uniref:DUF7548 family protein n=1 Tax=Haloprofundus salinisoli TaxID=2876193 RepID=UPI001CCC06C2|nr:hypothetical protein [Haloprofundus salinisoli]
MRTADAAATAGTVVSLVLLVVVAVPYLVVTNPAAPLSAYYAAGSVGANSVGFLSVIAAVAFLSGTRGNAEPDLVAGIAVVLGLAMVVLSLLWATTIDSTLLFSFPPEAAWIQYHRWAVVALSAVVAVVAGVYAREVV